MTGLDILLLITIIIAVLLLGIIILNRWAVKRFDKQQDLIDKSKTVTNIFVIDKKKMKINDANLPKVIIESIPKFYRVFKMPMVQAKIGNKIMNLICDKKAFKTMPIKKSIKVELAGIYIVNVVGKK